MANEQSPDTAPGLVPQYAWPADGGTILLRYRYQTRRHVLSKLASPVPHVQLIHVFSPAFKGRTLVLSDGHRRVYM